MVRINGGYDKNDGSNQSSLKPITINNIDTKTLFNVVLMESCMTSRTAYNSNLQEEYKGWSPPGSSEKVAKWFIKKTTYNSDNQESEVNFASSGSGDNIWDLGTTTHTYAQHTYG